MMTAGVLNTLYACTAPSSQLLRDRFYYGMSCYVKGRALLVFLWSGVRCGWAGVGCLLSLATGLRPALVTGPFPFPLACL